MCEGARLYQQLIDVLASKDLKLIKSFIGTLERECKADGISFYGVSAVLLELEEFSSWLDAQDPRGLSGSGKGAKKKDVMIACRRVCSNLGDLKENLREKELQSQKDYRYKYQEFLPRQITRNMDHGLPGPLKKKIGNR